jgi:hypothetical protein
LETGEMQGQLGRVVGYLAGHPVYLRCNAAFRFVNPTGHLMQVKAAVAGIADCR